MTTSAVKQLFVLLFLLACSPKEQRPLTQFSGQTMGTTFSIKLAKRLSQNEQQLLQENIQRLLQNINSQMSTYLAESEISRFNSKKTVRNFHISKEFMQVLKTAVKINLLTKGAFDITVGPLVNLWGFGPEKDRNHVPKDWQIEERRKWTGMDLLHLTSSSSIAKKHPKLYIDLSAIAKGYAVDAVSKLLLLSGYSNHMVEIGGEIRTMGQKSENEKWRIAIESPSPQSNRIGKILELSNQSIATSGDYRNFFSQNKQRYSHTIDPRSGRPVTHQLTSVSVIDDSCVRADAMATALMVMGPEKGHQFAIKHKLAAYFVIREGEHLTEKMTSLFNRYIRAQ